MVWNSAKFAVRCNASSPIARTQIALVIRRTIRGAYSAVSRTATTRSASIPLLSHQITATGNPWS
jgi:hypothetical protein